MLRRPPRSTLFPTRRSSDLGRTDIGDRYRHRARIPMNTQNILRDRSQGVRAVADRPQRLARSEEHTSELQSHSDLVCRLLLEKKKTITTHKPTQSQYFTLPY